MALDKELTVKTVVLTKYCESGPPTSEYFRIDESKISTDLEEGDVLVQALVFSADPYIRTRIKSSANTFHPDKPLAGFQAGKVLASRNERFKEGQFYGGSLPFATHTKLSAKAAQGIWDLSEVIKTEDEISLGVGVLGMPGSTAYGGFIDVLRPNEGETVFVSAAAGAVGSLVGQLAKNVYKCKVIGSCGGDEKADLIKTKFGFDHAIDYKKVSTAEELEAKLREAAPEGIDMYFENVGGIHFEAAMNTLRQHGRVAVCGCISEYNADKPAAVPFKIWNTIYNYQRVEGFMCAPWLTGQKGNFKKDMRKWIDEGKLKVEETFFDGIEQWPDAFLALFTGKNRGKVVIRA